MSLPLLVPAVALVAFTNGANANSKGVASLYGSGTTSLRGALVWGTAATFAGSIASAFLARGLLAAFSGRGLVPDAVARTPGFLTAVAAGAALTSLLATRGGFPVSTTHALVGGLAGAGLAAGGGVQWGALGRAFLYPLAVSPLLAAALAAGGCVVVAAVRRLPDRRGPWLDPLHFASTAAASFARGLNDTPKMAALLSVVPDVEAWPAFLGIATLIALGGLLDARNVGETLGRKVTGMTPGEGFVASLVTAVLVAMASLHGLPVSTTHVSVGALAGVGGVSGRARWGKVREILLAWLCTVPCGAILAAIAYRLLVSGRPG